MLLETNLIDGLFGARPRGPSHSQKPFTSLRWRFGLARDFKPGQHEAEIDGYMLANAG
jgi:hypothetical protein